MMALISFEKSVNPWIHINTSLVEYCYKADFPSGESKWEQTPGNDLSVEEASASALYAASVYLVCDEVRQQDCYAELPVLNAGPNSYCNGRFKILSNAMAEYDILVSVNGREFVFRFLNKEDRDMAYDTLCNAEK